MQTVVVRISQCVWPGLYNTEIQADHEAPLLRADARALAFGDGGHTLVGGGGQAPQVMGQKSWNPVPVVPVTTVINSGGTTLMRVSDDDYAAGEIGPRFGWTKREAIWPISEPDLEYISILYSLYRGFGLVSSP